MANPQELDDVRRQAFRRGRWLYRLEILTFIPTMLRYLLRADPTSARRGLRACAEALRALIRGNIDAELASRVCPLCGWRGRRFGPVYYYHEYREDARCPGCGSYERHRALAMLSSGRLRIAFSTARNVLDIAPNLFSRALFPVQAGYLSFDLRSPWAMVHGDLTRAPLPSEHFDIWMCFHVLDVIPDDGAAMRELHRVLSPNGVGILDNTTIWDAPTKDYDRPQRGACNRIRCYGVDLLDRLRAAGFSVEVVDVEHEFSAAERTQAGLIPQRFVLCRRETRAAEP